MAGRQPSHPAYRIDVQVARPFRSALRTVWLRRIARHVLAAEGAGPTQMGVVVTDDATVRDLNQRYLDVDEPTDVLSFGLGEKADAPFALPPGEAPSLGEVIIAYPTAVRQGEEQGHSVETEVAHLLVHGILHLLGYDHVEAEEERIMRRREREILADLEAASF
jgi:probable rRNA maturation factor